MNATIAHGAAPLPGDPVGLGHDPSNCCVSVFLPCKSRTLRTLSSIVRLYGSNARHWAACTLQNGMSQVIELQCVRDCSWQYLVAGIATTSWRFLPFSRNSLAKIDKVARSGFVVRCRCILAGSLVETKTMYLAADNTTHRLKHN